MNQKHLQKIFTTIILILTFAAQRNDCQEERQLPRWRPFLDGQPPARVTTYSGNLREKLLERNLAPPGRGARIGPGTPQPDVVQSGPISPQGLPFHGDYKSREEWESLRVGVEGSGTDLPTVQRNARHPGSPYFPVENVRPVLSQSETTTKNQGEISAGVQPSTPEEDESGPSRYGSNNRRNEERVDLKTKYFQITERNDVISDDPSSSSLSTTRVPSRVPILVKKLAKIPILRGTTDFPKVVAAKNVTDLCKSRMDIIECDPEDDDKTGSDVANKANLLPASFEPLLRHLRGEIWVVPVLVASACLAVVLIVFEIYLVSQVVRSSRRHQYPSRRHLFLGQMLIIGLFLCCGAAVVYTLKPSVAVCSVTRVATGFAYSVVYATLLVKLVFLISLNSGVYLPATYQSLLLCFAVLIQLVIGIQWLVSSPAEVNFSTPPPIVAEAATVQKPLMNLSEIAEEAISSCNVTFQQELLGMLYVLFLVLVVVILAFKARGVRENYREAMYIGLTMGFTVCIFLVWMLAGLMSPIAYQDVCISCGLVATAAISFVIMFMPKGRQLSAMGKEGVYAEDRTDVYTGTGSSTQSTASGGTSGHEGGTPSPSFFPIQPHNAKAAMAHRERIATPQSPKKHRNLTENTVFQSPDSSPVHHRRDHLHHFEHKSNIPPIDFHQAFHRQQRASHRAIFGGDQKHSSHSHQNGRLNNNDHRFGRSPTRAKTSGTAWKSDEEPHQHFNQNLLRLSERWRRSRSSPPRGRHWRDADIFHHDRHTRHKDVTPQHRWRATSHGDLARVLNDDSADDDWPNLGHSNNNRLPGFGFRSSHDLHAANEARASRSDLRDIREQLLQRGNSHNDLRSSRRNISTVPPWDSQCQKCTGVLNSDHHRNRHNQNFHSYNPRSPSTDTEDLMTHRHHQGVFRY